MVSGTANDAVETEAARSGPQLRAAPSEEESPQARLGEQMLARFSCEVTQAVDVLSYAIETGYPMDKGIVNAIRSAEAALALAPSSATVQQRVQFDLAFRELSGLVYPVTASTLRLTAATDEKHNPAHQVSTMVWTWTWIALLGVLVGEIVKRLADGVPAPVSEVAQGHASLGTAWAAVLALIFMLVTPFGYGLLGTCAQLLRKLHRTIHERTFDINRRHEYKNRMLLGLVSGGIVRILFEQAFDFDGKAITGAALAFIAGYQNDFLFTTVERVSAALFPKLEPPDLKEPRAKGVVASLGQKERLGRGTPGGHDQGDGWG